MLCGMPFLLMLPKISLCRLISCVTCYSRLARPGTDTTCCMLCVFDPSKARYKGERCVSAHRTSWPAAYWDDWMRLSSVRKGRQSIRPEVCRTYNFGAKGSSHGQYYRKYLQPIKLNDEVIDWPNQDLRYLEAAAYQSWLNGLVEDAKLVSSAEEIQQEQSPVKLMYANREEYEALADQLGMISDWKDGIPRASYKGVVSVRVAGVRCMLVPSNQTRLSGDQTLQIP